MKITSKIILLLTLSFSISLLGQKNEDPGSSSEQDEIDTSKPTNFYSFLDNTLEYSSQENQNVFGYRGKVTLALSEAHMVLAEVPLLYNDRTKSFGLSDIRARYFWLPYKNYEKLLGAFGPSLDIFAPTGDFKKGLGSGRWIISPGFTVGIMAADWIQFFPILSYQYASKPIYDNPSPTANKETHGLSFQVLVPIIITDKFFIQVTPIFKMNNFNDERNDRYEQELFANYALNSKMQLTAFYSGKFEDKNHTVSGGLSIFF
jgi:hypothetical protein